MIKKKIVSVVLVVVLLFVSCGDGQNPIPHTKVNFTVPVNTYNLIHVGGYEYFTGGICGIVVYRVDMSTFCAYDRACPYDWQENGYVIYDPPTLQLICTECGSTFGILDGFPKSNSITNHFLR
jgi:hypothetical protein